MKSFAPEVFQVLLTLPLLLPVGYQIVSGALLRCSAPAPRALRGGLGLQLLLKSLETTKTQTTAPEGRDTTPLSLVL